MGPLQEKMSLCSETGVIHLPTVHRSAPGHPRGSYKYQPCPLDDGKCMHMVMSSQWEGGDVFIEFTIPPHMIPDRKKFKLSMRFQTDKQQQPLQLRIREKDEQDVKYETTIPLPNTSNQWTIMDPIMIDCDLGLQPTILEFRHPKPVGKGILIRDFSLIPARSYGQYSPSFFQQWLQDLRSKLQSKLPTMDPATQKAFQQNACQQALMAHQKRSKAQNQSNEKDEGEAHKEYLRAMDHCMKLVKPWLQGPLHQFLQKLDWTTSEGKEILQCVVLAHGGPRRIADYCVKGDVETQRMMDFLNDNPELIHEMLVHGGPKNGSYGKALDIYMQIEAIRKEGKSVLPRLQLAVALELCEPMHVAWQPNVPIDPIERYLHFESAYLDRELDPTFETHSVWLLRMVVDADASHDDITWTRSMIRNYNPNVAIMDDYNWRYSWIVRTDVYYKEPEWTRKIKDYKQIISGGGKCGPRAWMGRLACKAFGNPTWGVRQPGHAAMTRWTPTGWITSLGGGFHRSWWEHRQGPDFLCEAKIRGAQGDEVYFQSTGILNWIGVAIGEKMDCGSPTPNHLWTSLAFLQRVRLSEKAEPAMKPKNVNGQCEIHCIISERKQTPDKQETIVKGNDGSIVVPVSTRKSKTGPTNFMKSFLGGSQVFLKPEWVLVYRIPASLAPATRKKYKISFHVVTVHEKDYLPLQVCIQTIAGKALRDYAVSLPYTWGKFQDTDPVEIELDVSTEKIVLSRKDQKYPFTMKDFRLIPC